MSSKAFLFAKFTPTVQPALINLQTFSLQPLPCKLFAEPKQYRFSNLRHLLAANSVAQLCSQPRSAPPQYHPDSGTHSPGSISALPKPCLTATPVPLDFSEPQLYLKHVVSSPEDFRHGYLVVVILFSEHTSLREEEKKVEEETP